MLKILYNVKCSLLSIRATLGHTQDNYIIETNSDEPNFMKYDIDNNHAEIYYQ